MPLKKENEKKKTFSINPIIISSNPHQYNTTNKLATTKVFIDQAVISLCLIFIIS